MTLLLLNFSLQTVSIKVALEEVVPGSTESENSEHIEEPLSIAWPSVVKPNYKLFLSGFRLAPRLVLLTATGVPVRSGPHSDVVVVTRTDPTTLCAEVEHITSLWKFNKKGKGMVSSPCGC